MYLQKDERIDTMFLQKDERISTILLQKDERIGTIFLQKDERIDTKTQQNCTSSKTRISNPPSHSSIIYHVFFVADHIPVE